MRKHYNKLVRDKIPAIIAADGKSCALEPMGSAAFRRALAMKLLEEAQEVQAALLSDDPKELIKELADVLEVVDAIVSLQDFDLADLRDFQSKRRAQRGGFDQRLNLLWVDSRDDPANS